LAFGSQDVDHKRTRLKFALFLQGSSAYDATHLRERLLQHSQILNIELAIVDGKLNLHKEALSILVNDLQDATTAEAYCSLGGHVIPLRIATMIGEELGLAVWASLIVGKGILQRSGLASSSEEEKKKHMLTMMLVEVYISSGKGKAEHAARILNAQAINLEVGEVLSMVPPEWSLNLIASFLSQSFRRTLHDRYESQILKQLSTGQNLQTSEFAFETFAAAGAVIEEPAPGQDPEEYIVVEDENHENQQAAEMPEGEESPPVLSNREKEKALPPLSVTQVMQYLQQKGTPRKRSLYRLFFHRHSLTLMYLDIEPDGHTLFLPLFFSSCSKLIVLCTPFDGRASWLDSDQRHRSPKLLGDLFGWQRQFPLRSWIPKIQWV